LIVDSPAGKVKRENETKKESFEGGKRETASGDLRAIRAGYNFTDPCLPFRARRFPGENLMVVGHHLIWTAYGWWLPNDPRGSSSHEVRVAPMAELGDLHHGRKTVQPRSAEIRQFYDQARDILKHELLALSADDICVVGRCLGQVIQRSGYTCYACAVMPDHVHLLIRRHRDKAEMMVEVFQKASRLGMIESGRRAPTHPVWRWAGVEGVFEYEGRYGADRAVHSGEPGESGEGGTALGLCETV
jgi:REP element-mobilizing transposase RayT